MTQNKSLISIVPRHSYTPENLYPDAKNRAMLRFFSAGDKTLPRSENTGPAFTCSATQTHFIAGPL
jgi:hypothetical protein